MITKDSELAWTGKRGPQQMRLRAAHDNVTKKWRRRRSDRALGRWDGRGRSQGVGCGGRERTNLEGCNLSGLNTGDGEKGGE